METSLTEATRGRIISATSYSKIALFRAGTGNNKSVVTVFANTVTTTKRIKNNDIDYLGSYYGRDGIDRAVKDIARYMNGY